MRTLSAVPTTEGCVQIYLGNMNISIQDSQLGPSDILYREVPLYSN